MLSDEFDSVDPAWNDNNYLGRVVDESGFHRGTLDDLEAMWELDVDEPANGDPVTETPDDPAEWLDPDVITFVDNPDETRAPTYDDDMEPLRERMEAETGKEIEFMTVSSYAATVEALRARQAHAGAVPAGSVPWAANLADYVPVATRISGDDFGYRLYALTRADMNDIQSVEDFAGRNIAHADPGSNSGHQAPSAFFDDFFGVTAGEDYEIEFSGGHDQSVRGIGFGDYEAGPVCSTCMENTIEHTDELEWDDFKIVWASEPFVGGNWGLVADLHPDIKEGLERAWLETDWDETGVVDLPHGWTDAVEIDYKRHYHNILVTQAYLDTEYETGEL
ncbi:phosphate/phosphite/phosphonate ABC transporter substrate-binding protein [Natrarchaeobius sp. A-rgal3]|uniref:phosphate/phosphite/phosphonate ABC transporter substrate-binding protein n=1 Tax=Natrarchaeobius versutus TaxID=1679078 RepID=UPI00350F7328